MDKKRGVKGIEICSDCEKAILASGPLGALNLSYLERVSKLKIVPKSQCQRCKAQKELK